MHVDQDNHHIEIIRSNGVSTIPLSLFTDLFAYFSLVHHMTVTFRMNVLKYCIEDLNM